VAISKREQVNNPLISKPLIISAFDAPIKKERISVVGHPITGNPNPQHISTSYIERQNLTMRMSMRRFTRLTNAFSKKVKNLAAAIALHFMYYNFRRVHKTLRVTPAMEAGISDHVWTLEDVAKLLD
jgi:hypothetical protein